MHFIFIALLGLITFVILNTIRLEWRSFSRSRGYRKLGIKRTTYIFWLVAYLKMLKRYRSNDLFTIQKSKLIKWDSKDPFYVRGINGRCSFTLMSPEAISEFYKKELKYTYKKNSFITLKFLAFFFQNGEEVHKGRAAFAKIFHYSNVMRLMPQIIQIIKRHVQMLKKRVSKTKEMKLSFDLKEEFLHELFEDLTGCILLTGADNKIDATFNGMGISQILKKMFTCFETHPRQLMTRIPFAERLGLSPAANEFRRLQNGFRKIIADQYKRRYNSATEEDLVEHSILDIMVKLNKKSERETGKPQFTLEEISNNFEMFQFAASDTSFQATCSYLCLLAQPENQIYQEDVYAELKAELEYNEELDDNKLSSLRNLDLCFRETMRMQNPAPQIATRVAAKDFKLCGYQIKKGDFIRLVLLQYQPSFFKDPYKFKPERFEEEARKNIPFEKQIPFSYGERGCMGRYLGEMIVKLIVSELVSNFKFEVKKGYEMKMGLNPLYGVANPEVTASLRFG